MTRLVIKTRHLLICNEPSTNERATVYHSTPLLPRLSRSFLSNAVLLTPGSWLHPTCSSFYLTISYLHSTYNQL